MTATSNVPTRAIPETQTDVHPLNTIAVFCALVLGVSLCLATYGLDLSAGFSDGFAAATLRSNLLQKLNLKSGG